MKEIYVKPEVTSEVLEPGALALKGSPIVIMPLLEQDGFCERA